MAENIVQSLRDVILLQADFMRTHADILDQYARGDVSRTVLDKRMKVAAVSCQQRAKMLNDVLAATEPTGAKTL